jgi:hypothetical protein
MLIITKDVRKEFDDFISAQYNKYKFLEGKKVRISFSDGDRRRKKKLSVVGKIKWLGTTIGSEYSPTICFDFSMRGYRQSDPRARKQFIETHGYDSNIWMDSYYGMEIEVV